VASLIFKPPPETPKPPAADGVDASTEPVKSAP
jgi:hypothetical protein